MRSSTAITKVFIIQLNGRRFLFRQIYGFRCRYWRSVRAGGRRAKGYINGGGAEEREIVAEASKQGERVKELV